MALDDSNALGGIVNKSLSDENISLRFSLHTRRVMGLKLSGTGAPGLFEK